MRLNAPDIQTKIILVLVAVIVPTFLVSTIIQYKVTRPILEEEWKQIGISTAESLALKVISNRWLTHPQRTALIEGEIQMQIYLQPSIMRMEVFTKEGDGALRLIASNVEEEDPASVPSPIAVEKVTYEFQEDEAGIPLWLIRVPIRYGPSKTSRVAGLVRVFISTKSVNRLMETSWRITAVAAAVSVIVLILVLSYFLRRAVVNERLLRQAHSRNLALSERLHEAQRQLMNVEKLAVMGQLTANFAHEIGTPLNAISGHLQLLREELAGLAAPSGAASQSVERRCGIIQGELLRIEEIVRGFLHTTSKPPSQRQLVDLNFLVDKTLEIVRPRVDALGVRLERRLERSLGPLRAVPLEIEQVLLNLLNNALDSLHTKLKNVPESRLELRLETAARMAQGKEWAEIRVRDTGLGIPKRDLKNVLKPFFTTKSPGEGTGLGLTISQELLAKYGGELMLDAKEGSWAEARMRIPYQANA